MKLLYIALIAMVAMTTVTATLPPSWPDNRSPPTRHSQHFRSKIAQLQSLKAQAAQQFYQQYAMEQQLQAAAAAAALNPKAIVDTVNGLTQAVSFWGSFIGNEIFDVQYVKDRISELSTRKENLEKYASTDGTKALVQMNQAIWGINANIKAIEAMAKLLKRGASNVRKISIVADSQKTEKLSGDNKKIYTAAIKVLTNNLKSSNLAAGKIQAQLNNYSKLLIGIQSTFQSVSARLRDTAAGKSREFKEWRDATRAKVYGGCAASILAGPVGLAACYATSAAILETNIKKYQNKVNQFTADFTKWAKTFDNLSTLAGKAAQVSKSWYGKVTDYKVVIEGTLQELDAGFVPLLYLKKGLRSLVDSSLQTLIIASDQVIKDAGDQLKTNVKNGGYLEYLQMEDLEQLIQQKIASRKFNKKRLSSIGLKLKAMRKARRMRKKVLLKKIKTIKKIMELESW